MTDNSSDDFEDYIYSPRYIKDLFSKEKVKRETENFALAYLAKQLSIYPGDLIETVKLLRNGSPLYKIGYQPKKSGGKRQFCIPQDDRLKIIQRKISDNILRELKHPEFSKNVFGFSGGNVRDAIIPHLQSKIILCVDCKKAFPTINYDNIFNYFGRHYYWYATRALTELTSYNKLLPEGVSTSPRLFDLICYGMDKSLLRLAKNSNGVYTRYADNIFFSLPSDEFPFPEMLKRTILRIIRGCSRKEPKFEWHKLKIRKMDKPLKILGLNVIDGKIYNTRSFKRRLRLAIHHIEYLMNNKLDTSKAWQKLQGLMGFAIIDTLPEKLLSEYQAVLQKKKGLNQK